MPPGGFPPPPPGWFPPPAPRQRSFARAIFTTLATTVFGLSIALNLYLLVFSGIMSSRSTREDVIIDGDPKEKIAVVPIVNSMILEAQAEQLNHLLDTVEKDPEVKALVIKIDTPGGAVTAADEMYHRIAVFKSRKPGIPVVISMGGFATSGGYYAACAGDYIFAQPTTITGNIGVLLPQYNLSRLADKWGIEDASIHSTGADYKTAGSWLRPRSPEETAYLTDLIDAAFVQFKTVVKNGRVGKLTQSVDQIANGKAYTADEAVKLGLVDTIGYPADAYAYAAQKAGLTRMHVVKFEEPPTFAQLFSSSESKFSPAKASGGVQINGVQVDAGKLEELLKPQLLYLWQGN